MNRNISEMAQALGVQRDQVKKWAVLFDEYLSEQTKPSNGQSCCFSDLDFLVFAYISTLWENEPDLEHIKIGLNREDYLEKKFYESLYLNSPILQEPPEDLDETWRHGVLWVGGHGQKCFELARNYRYVAEKMLDQALQNNEARHWLCPVLFTYRHTLELYLKTIGNINERTHSLAKCAALVEKVHGEKFNSRAKGWIEELDKIDPHPGTTFRYEGDQKQQDYGEFWVDLRQFKFAMGQVCEMIDRAIVRVGTKSK